MGTELESASGMVGWCVSCDYGFFGQMAGTCICILC